jgi:hypothetical protein
LLWTPMSKFVTNIFAKSAIRSLLQVQDIICTIEFTMGTMTLYKFVKYVGKGLEVLVD